MIRYVMTTLLGFILVFSAAGCGKKGKLEDPKEEKVQYPRQYPR